MIAPRQHRLLVEDALRLARRRIYARSIVELYALDRWLHRTDLSPDELRWYQREFKLAITRTQSGVAAAGDGSSSTVAASLTGVAAGALIVVAVAWLFNGTTVTGVTDTTSSLTPLTATSGDGGVTQFWYLLSANSGNRTYTATIDVSSTFRRMVVFEFSYSGSAAFDVENGNSANFATTLATGNVTTTGTDEVALTCANYSDAEHSANEQINSVNADEVIDDGSNFQTWYRIVGSTFTGQGTATQGETNYVTRLASFKATAGGGGTPAPPIFSAIQRARVYPRKRVA